MHLKHILYDTNQLYSRAAQFLKKNKIIVISDKNCDCKKKKDKKKICKIWPKSQYGYDIIIIIIIKWKYKNYQKQNIILLYWNISL